MAPILFQEVPTHNGYCIGRVTLNAPKSLNALSHEMVSLLSAKLTEWERQPLLACIYLEGAGGKAFCAGGDIREVYSRITSNDEQQLDAARQFIVDEYDLDYQIYSYPKPIICCGDGIVMGGGLGLLAAASHRIVTECSKLAMPEIKIGLYPDVGATYFLGKLHNNLGTYIGLTSAMLNSADARYIKLVDYSIKSESISTIMPELQKLKWTEQTETNSDLTTTFLRLFEINNSTVWPKSKLIIYEDHINVILSHNALNDIVVAIADDENAEDTWLKQNAQALAYGSPRAAHLIYQQMQNCRELSREQVRDLEMRLSHSCFETGEFAEGVRALLIDKDFEPKWNDSSIDEVDTNPISALFK